MGIPLVTNNPSDHLPALNDPGLSLCMNQDRINYTACPACGQPSISFWKQVKDYSVSQENFEVWECADCQLRFTQQVPGPAAIAPYYKSENYISHTNTNKGLVNRLYHLVRNYTLQEKCRLVKATTGLATGEILDVGAGTGYFLAAMKKAGWKITGIEPDALARQQAAQSQGIQLLTAESLFQLPEAHFDVITLWHVLEHVHDLHAYLDQLMRLLKPGGHLMIAVPNYTSADATYYAENWAAYDVPRHLYHFAPGSMIRLLQQHGFRFLSTRPMRFDSYYVSLLSERYKHSSAALLRGFLRGWKSNRRAAGGTNQFSSLIYLAQK